MPMTWITHMCHAELEANRLLGTMMPWESDKAAVIAQEVWVKAHDVKLKKTRRLVSSTTGFTPTTNLDIRA